MMFIYSGTGNSYHVARHIADALDHKIIDMAVAHRYNRHTYDAEGGDVIFVVPVYCMGLPHTVMEFASKLDVRNPGRVYCVSTFAGSSGIEARQLSEQLNGRLTVDGCFGVRMPNNAVSYSEPPTPEEASEILAQADAETDSIIERIRNGDVGDMRTIRYEGDDGDGMYAGYEDFRVTEHFHVNDRCIECRVCEEVCNTRVIKIYHRKPVWDEEKCDMCMSCLNLCPKQAIEYGDSTQGRRRYFHKDYKNKVLGIPLRY